jgi:hypothetical protein
LLNPPSAASKLSSGVQACPASKALSSSPAATAASVKSSSAHTAAVEKLTKLGGGLSTFADALHAKAAKH